MYAGPIVSIGQHLLISWDEVIYPFGLVSCILFKYCMYGIIGAFWITHAI